MGQRKWQGPHLLPSASPVFISLVHASVQCLRHPRVQRAEAGLEHRLCAWHWRTEPWAGKMVQRVKALATNLSFMVDGKNPLLQLVL